MSNQELLQDNRSLGWAQVPAEAPAWVRNRIIEIRAALIEKRGVPAPSAEYCTAAEQRCLAAGRFINRLFPTTRTSLSTAQLRRRAERLGEEIRQSTVFMTREERFKLYDASGLRAPDAADIIAERRRCFPWETEN